jgi:hypothetical protein
MQHAMSAAQKREAGMNRFSYAALALLVACGGPQTETTTPTSQPTAAPTATDAATAAPTVEPTATAATVTPPPPADPAPIVVGAMKLTITTKKKGEKGGTVELAADGTVKKDGKVALKFVKNELQDADGKWVLRVNADGAVENRVVSQEIDAKTKKVIRETESVESLGKLTDNGIDKDGKGITVGDDGKVTAVQGGKPGEVMAELKLEGMKPETKRAAVLLVAALLSPSKMTSTTTETAPVVPTPSKTPSKTPAPAKK